jgi:hypothetical protein
MTRYYYVTIIEENGVEPALDDEWTDFVMSAKQLTEQGESGWIGKMYIKSIDITVEEKR